MVRIRISQPGRCEISMVRPCDERLALYMIPRRARTTFLRPASRPARIPCHCPHRPPGWPILDDRLVNVSTLKAYLTGLRSAYVDFGFTVFGDPFHHPMPQRVVAGIRKYRGETKVHEREPFIRDLPLRVLLLLDTSTQYSATIRAAFCLTSAGFPRIGEFTHSQSDLNYPQFDRLHVSVMLHRDHIELSLPSSKLDPFRRGILLTIVAADDDACPVRPLRRLFERYPHRLSLSLSLSLYHLSALHSISHASSSS
jgi:hypothetical protein